MFHRKWLGATGFLFPFCCCKIFKNSGYETTPGVVLLNFCASRKTIIIIPTLKISHAIISFNDLAELEVL